jgi:hypothetical protein
MRKPDAEPTYAISRSGRKVEELVSLGGGAPSWTVQLAAGLAAVGIIVAAWAFALGLRF